MFRAYTNDNDKYSDNPTDNFTPKFNLFNEHCEQNFIDEETKQRFFHYVNGPCTTILP